LWSCLLCAARFFNHCLNERWLSPEGFPKTRFSALMSSSRSGQWMPSPAPIRRQLLRSSGVPCKSRGYHARGAETVRPSVKSSTSASSVTLTCCAVAIRTSTAKVFIPTPQETFSVFLYEPLYPIDFASAKTSAVLKPNRVEPKLCFFPLPLPIHKTIPCAAFGEDVTRAQVRRRWLRFSDAKTPDGCVERAHHARRKAKCVTELASLYAENQRKQSNQQNTDNLRPRCLSRECNQTWLRSHRARFRISCAASAGLDRRC